MRTLTTPDPTPAVDLLDRTARGTTVDRLDDPTPCGSLTVRELLAHVLVALHHSATAASGTEPPGGAAVAVLDDGRWRAVLARRGAALAAAWAQPQAWTGATIGGGVSTPAQEAGRVAAMEVVLHGWDLAVATGQPFRPDTAAVDAVLELVHQWQDAEGRDAVFGPVVSVPPQAPALHRALGPSGRDPARTPQA